MQADEDGEELRPDYNVAPTKKIYAVMTRRPPGLAGAGEGGSTEGNGAEGTGAEGNGEAAAGDPAPVRQLRTVRWGLVPSWAKDPAIGSRMINARAETVASKPAYRRAFTYLNHHGAATCTDADPHCHICPLLKDCPEGRRRSP